MAIGTDRTIVVETPEDLQALADKEQPGLIILLKQAINDDCN
jgi:electron transfer flavoprotein beta subunit